MLWSIQPRLVILRATAFGQDGPYRERPGFARIFEAMGGLNRRVKHAAELNGIFVAWCAALPLDEVLARFNAAQGTLAPIYAIDQIAGDPQMKAREVITRVPDKDFGTVAMTNVVPRFANDPARMRHAAGDVGQDNDEVFRNWLGLTEQQIERLTERRVI